MGYAFPEILARSAARQVYRLLRLSAPLLRPLYRHVGLEQRARAVMALVRVSWNGAAVAPPLIRESEIVAGARLLSWRPRRLLFEFDLEHLVGLAAAGCRHLDDVVLALAEQRARKRRGDRDLALLHIGF